MTLAHEYIIRFIKCAEEIQYISIMVTGKTEQFFLPEGYIQVIYFLKTSYGTSTPDEVQNPKFVNSLTI